MYVNTDALQDAAKEAVKHQEEARSQALRELHVMTISGNQMMRSDHCSNPADYVTKDGKTCSACI